VVGLQGGVERRRLGVRKFDPPRGGLVVDGLGDRPRRFWPGIGFGSRFQLNRGAQLADRGDTGQLRIVLIGAVGRPPRDDAHLIQRQPTLTHARRTAGELFEPVRNGGNGVSGA
jgi:hypothetical protein